MNTEKEAILDALDSFVNQRPGMDPRNYGDWRAYRSESRNITRDLHNYRTLRRAVAWRDSITADDLKAAFRAFSGRLTCKVEPVYTSGKLNVIPGHVTGYTELLNQCELQTDTIERLQRELAARDKTIETLREQRDSWHKQYCLASEREADCVAKMALMREQYQREIARMAQHGIAKADAARSEGEKPR